ncbi:MAG: hypothetical protein IPN69_17700 [Acidobacteria bacterium]|nr:hypothetical protein [Acidobacteriota bacterium]
MNDLAVCWSETGTWYVRNSNNTGYTIRQFGIAEDVPMSHDMDGDGKGDITVFRPSTGDWYFRFAVRTAASRSPLPGAPGDKAGPGRFRRRRTRRHRGLQTVNRRVVHLELGQRKLRHPPVRYQ